MAVNPSAWAQSVIQSFTTQTATWVVGVVITILTIFSSKIVEDIKFAINKADLRSKYYEELVSDVSEFRFTAEIWIELLEHGWTTAENLKVRVNEYNDSISKLRKKEWVYRSWLKRYWHEKQAKAFAQYMDTVKAFDVGMHGLNDEIEAVAIKKSRDKFDPNTAAMVTKRLEAALKRLQDDSTNLIGVLEK